MARYPLHFEIGYIFSVIEIPSSAIVIILCISELRSSSHVCILWLALSTFILGTTYIGFASPKEGSLACFAQYFAQQYFSLTIFLSVVLLASHIGSLNFVFLQERQRFELTFKSYAFVWGTSLLLAILPLVTNSIGKSFSDDIISICWISNKSDVDYIVMLVSYYIPLYCSAIYISFTCAKILWKARKHVIPNILKQHLCRLFLYAVVLMLCSFPAIFIHTSNFIHDREHFSSPTDWLMSLAVGAMTVQWLIYIVIFGSTQKYLRFWKKFNLACIRRSKVNVFHDDILISGRVEAVTGRPTGGGARNWLFGQINQQENHIDRQKLSFRKKRVIQPAIGMQDDVENAADAELIRTVEKGHS